MILLTSGETKIRTYDFRLTGILPFEFYRNYDPWITHSNSGVSKVWNHNYNQHIEVEKDCLFWTNPNGNIILLQGNKPGEPGIFKKEKIILTQHEDYIEIEDYSENLYYVFKPINKSCSYRLVKVYRYNFSIELSYNLSGELKCIRDSAYRTLDFEHNNFGQITRIVLRNTKKPQVLASYQYDDKQRLISAKDAVGNEEKYAYNGNLLIAQTDRNGNTHHWEYESDKKSKPKCIRQYQGNGFYKETFEYQKGKTIMTDARGNKTTYCFEGENLTQVTDPLGNSEYWSYDMDDQMISHTDALGYKTYYAYDDEYGHQVSVGLPNGGGVQYIYDGTRITTAKNAKGALWIWKYDEHGQVICQIGHNNDITKYEYNDNHLLSKVISPEGEETYLHYTKEHFLSKVMAPNGLETRWEYDEYGQVKHVSNNQNQLQTYVYDPLGRVSRFYGVDMNTLDLTYDALGNVIRAKDQKHDVAFAYSPSGKLLERKENDTSIFFKYNKADLLTAVVNERNHSYNFARDAAGNITGETGFDGLKRTYKRNANGQVMQQLDAAGQTTNYQYNSVGLVERITYFNQQEDNYRYDPLGLLIEAENKNGTIVIERNELGQVVKEIQNGVTIESTYNATGNRTGLTSSLGASLAFERNKDNTIAATKANGSGTDWEAQYKYDALGLEIERSLQGGVASRWERQADGKPSAHIVSRGEQKLLKKSYSWDVNDRLRSITDNIGSGSVSFRYDSFGSLAEAHYPNLNQYDYKFPDEVGNLYRTEEKNDRKYGKAGQLLECPEWLYTYDSLGNLIEKKAKESYDTWRYSWNESGMLESVTRPDRKKVSFCYDALGRRTEKTYNGTTTHWIYDGNTPLHEWTSYKEPPPPLQGTDASELEYQRMVAEEKRKEEELDAIYEKDSRFKEETKRLRAEYERKVIRGELTEEEKAEQGKQQEANLLEDKPDLITWVFEEGTFIPQAKLQNGKSFSIITDHLGTPIMALDEQGKEVWQRQLDIYGKTRNLEGESSLIPFLYQGQYYDEETGLAYNRFRYYSPDSGTYLSQDPIGLHSGEPNLYAYVHDSNSWIDPFGLYLRRPYIRKATRQAIESNADISNGRFLDTNNPDILIEGGKRRKHSIAEGKYHLGHKTGNEFWREKAKAEAEGLTQKQFNDRMNNPDLYQIEDPHENMSHKYEKKKKKSKIKKGCH